MAIDRMKKVTVLCPVHAAQRLNRLLHELGTVELVDAHDALEHSEGVLKHQDFTTADCDVQINKINLILSLMDAFAPVHQTFFEGLTPLPLVIEPRELEEVSSSFDLESVYHAAHELDDTHKRAQRRMAEVKAQVEALAPLEDVPFAVADLRRPVRSRLLFGTVPTRALESLQERSDVKETFAWEIVAPGPALRSELRPNNGGRAQEMATRGERTRIVAAFLPDDEDAARKILLSEQFEEVPLPAIPGKVRDRIRELEGDYAACEEQVRVVREKAIDLAEHRREIQVLKAYWEDQRRRVAARTMAIEGRWIHVVTGYTRAPDVARLEQALQRTLPEATLTVEDPKPDEAVPVSLSMPNFVKPVKMLVNLFGLPPYTSFDPSPFIVFNFLLFFGICFGDVGYGLMLTALGFYLSRKTRLFEGVHNFSRLLFFAGISTTIFGVLLGSWFGDLYSEAYLGKDNLLLQLKEKTMVLDPLADPITMLVVSLSIGMVNQFYGIALKMYGAARRRDWVTAFCDGLLWLITLPGMVILVSTMFAPVPSGVVNAGLVLFVGGAIGLVLTQGRDAPGIIGKIGTGVVSLYGIVGSYGCTAFIGDVLSYCRLLALALTTSIVALTVNMIAGLLGEVKGVGPLLFVAVLVLGHVFNFSISLLGAFIHAMRLIFVEFFGRFYDSGAKPFKPFGFDTDSYVLKQPTSTSS